MKEVKKVKFTESQQEIADYFRVLSNPARIAILQHIIDQKACICSDLVDEIGLAQATISQYLKEIKDAGIIQGSVEGKSICYCINPDKWKEVQDLFNAFFDQEIIISTSCK